MVNYRLVEWRERIRAGIPDRTAAAVDARFQLRAESLAALASVGFHRRCGATKNTETARASGCYPFKASRKNAAKPERSSLWVATLIIAS